MDKTIQACLSSGHLILTRPQANQPQNSKTQTRSKIVRAHLLRKIRIFLSGCRTIVLQALSAF